VSGEDKVPTLVDWVQQVIFQHFGIWGLVGLALVTAAVFVWKHWGSVKTWPGIASVLAYLSREAIPRADPHRFSVAVAHLEDDNATCNHEKLIVRLLREFEGIQVLNFDRIISVKGPVPEEQERKGHETAREYLKKSQASILIWGSVLHYGGQTKPNLYLTAAGEQVGKPKQYTPEISSEFRMPKVFWDDLSEVLRLVIATQNTQFLAKAGHYVADRLPPFIERARSLLKASADRPGWDADALGSTRVILADALQTLGDQSGQNEPLEAAVAAYRAALKEYTRERVPLQWATTQNNLGVALMRLGEREGDTARLEDAVAAYRAALAERTRERVPLQWATTQNNLGTALSRLGAREAGTARLEEAVAAYRAALEERTRERVPLQWAPTQTNLGSALLTLGAREAGAARLEDAVAAYRAALAERTRERVPLDWAATQNNLGTALRRLGEREAGTARLEDAVAAYRAALSVFEPAKATYYVSVTQNNLKRAQALLERRRGS
jgi:tetratricopeptide (TPR) repeat protein